MCIVSRITYVPAADLFHDQPSFCSRFHHSNHRLLHRQASIQLEGNRNTLNPFCSNTLVHIRRIQTAYHIFLLLIGNENHIINGTSLYTSPAYASHRRFPQKQIPLLCRLRSAVHPRFIYHDPSLLKLLNYPVQVFQIVVQANVLEIHNIKIVLHSILFSEGYRIRLAPNI